MRAEASAEPVAKSGRVGFQAHLTTSDWWPSSNKTSLAGMAAEAFLLIVGVGGSGPSWSMGVIVASSADRLFFVAPFDYVAGGNDDYMELRLRGFRSHSCSTSAENGREHSRSVPSSCKCISASAYSKPFWHSVTKAPASTLTFFKSCL